MMARGGKRSTSFQKGEERAKKAGQLGGLNGTGPHMKTIIRDALANKAPESVEKQLEALFGKFGDKRNANIAVHRLLAEFYRTGNYKIFKTIVDIYEGTPVQRVETNTESTLRLVDADGEDVQWGSIAGPKQAE